MILGKKGKRSRSQGHKTQKKTYWKRSSGRREFAPVSSAHRPVPWQLLTFMLYIIIRDFTGPDCGASVPDPRPSRTRLFKTLLSTWNIAMSYLSVDLSRNLQLNSGPTLNGPPLIQALMKKACWQTCFRAPSISQYAAWLGLSFRRRSETFRHV